MAVTINGTSGVTFNGGSTLNPDSTAPSYACRAWVNFNGTGTVAIRASGNVTSITDNGTGDYTVNFTTAMPSANYTAFFANNDIAGGTVIFHVLSPTNIATAPTTYTTTAVRFIGASAAGAQFDANYVGVSIFC